MKRASLGLLLAIAASGCPEQNLSGDGSIGGSVSPMDLTSPEDASAELAIPRPMCPPPVQPVDTANPTTVVGDGSPTSCTEAALTAAVALGGIVTFRCGTAPLTIALTAELAVSRDLVLDGGGTVTLSGGGKTRILKVNSTLPQASPHLTVQNLRFIDGQVSGTLPAGDTTLGGAAIYRLGGSLTVLNCRFENNHGAESGQDQAGGAIFSVGTGETLIVGSTFQNNACSNGGAIGSLGSALTIYNSLVTGNRATGSGGSPGNGGNGGGILVDGPGKAVTACGLVLSDNQAQAFGGGMFRRGYGQEPTTISKSIIDSNHIPSGPFSKAGGLYLEDLTATISSTSVTRNTASSAGGLYLGSGAVLAFTNVTVSTNTAADSTGGGLAVDSSVTGRIWNCTFAYNRAPAANAFGGAIAGGGSGLTLQNTIVAYSAVGSGQDPISCTARLTSAGGNLQWPIARSGGGSDDPGALCANGVREQDPQLIQLKESVGGTLSHLLWCSSPAVRQGTNCPPTDQDGRTRSSPCSLGAIESCLVFD